MARTLQYVYQVLAIHYDPIAESPLVTPVRTQKVANVQFSGRAYVDTGHINAMLRENAANPGHTDREPITLRRGMRKFMRERGRRDVKIKMRVWVRPWGGGRRGSTAVARPQIGCR